jgi:hypothetical protein
LKNKLVSILTLITYFSFQQTCLAQDPDLGTAADFVLFSSNGAVSNTGISHLTGNIGSNNGASTAFGNVDGVMHDNDGASALCMGDLLTAYEDLDAAIPAFFPAPLLGNGQILTPGVYAISGNSTLNLNLILNGGNDPNASFIFQIDGAFAANAGASIQLINGAVACHVFWKIEGLVSLATGTKMRGTIIANNAAIEMQSGVLLEGRALSTTGAVTIDGISAYLPTGCGSPILTGPTAPELASTACYAIFSADGAVTNTGVTHVTGDIGTNNGLTTGYMATDVTGTIHAVPDVSTATAASDLANVYTSLNNLSPDIELLYPAQFGNSLVLTPHTYLLDGAATFTDTLFLNARGNADAVFVIQVNGALSTSTYAQVKLINGAQAKNIFWKVEGAVNINDYSNFKGTIVSNNGAISSLGTGATLEGRELTTNGAMQTAAITATITAGCMEVVGLDALSGTSKPAVSFYPNPWNTSLTVGLPGATATNSSTLRITDILGKVLLETVLTASDTTFTLSFPAGIYLYEVSGQNQLVQSGRLVSQH